MATLYLEHINRSLPTMRAWLDGDWGLLMSHPSDFEDHSLERDRWLEIVQEEFHGSRVKPIAYRRDGGEPDRGWVSTVTEDEQRVRLIYSDVIDIAAWRLREQIIDIPTERFVVVVDPGLLCHIILMYQRTVISPLDLIGPVVSLRSHAAHQDAVCRPQRAA